MSRILLWAANTPILILIAVFAIAVQTSLFSYYPFMYLQPDFLLLIVVWMGLKRGLGEGGVVTLILADLAEIHSGAPQGAMLIAYMSLFLVIRALDRLVLLNRPTHRVGLTMAASILWKGALMTVLYLLDQADNQWRHALALLLPGAVMEGLLAIWVYRWLEAYDWATYKNPRAQQQLEDEFRLEEEGL